MLVTAWGVSRVSPSSLNKWHFPRFSRLDIAVEIRALKAKLCYLVMSMPVNCVLQPEYQYVFKVRPASHIPQTMVNAVLKSKSTAKWDPYDSEVSSETSKGSSTCFWSLSNHWLFQFIILKCLHTTEDCLGCWLKLRFKKGSIPK